MSSKVLLDPMVFPRTRMMKRDDILRNPDIKNEKNALTLNGGGRSYIKRLYDILLVTCTRIIERCVFVDHRSANVLMAEELAHLQT